MTKTGWPTPELMQDDCRELFRWFASKPDSRRLVRDSAERIKVSSLTNHVSEWRNVIAVPPGVDQEYAQKIVQKRRQILLHSYIRWGLDRDILTNRQWVDWCRQLAHLQAAWGWEFNFYDSLFKDFRHVHSAKQLITNKGMDAMIVVVAAKLLQLNEDNKREQETLSE